MTAEPTAGELLAEITAVTDAVRTKTWVSDYLRDDPGVQADPLSWLDTAGLGWLAPFVSSLAEPLDQLRGNPSPVAAGAQEYDRAGQDITSAAATYRRSVDKETGDAGDHYRETGGQYADGLAVIGECSVTVASALAGTGELVARVGRIVTGIVAEAIGEIVPIMTEALAQAAATFGTSVAVAIPRCVRIASAAGQRIAGKLVALMASGQDLLELVSGAIAVMRVVTQVLGGITRQGSTREENG